MCCCCDYDTLRMAGVQRFSDHVPQNNHPIFTKGVIANQVMQQVLEPYAAVIRASSQYQAFESDKTKNRVGPGPNVCEDSKIPRYLDGHSVRKGLGNKFLGLLYRICEFFSEKIWGKSDKLTARHEIALLIQQKNKLMKNQSSDDIPTPEEYTEADTRLQDMLEEYETIRLKG